MHLLRPFSAPPERPALAGNSWQLPATRTRVTHSEARRDLCPIERDSVYHRRDSLLVVGAWAYGRRGVPRRYPTLPLSVFVNSSTRLFLISLRVLQLV